MEKHVLASAYLGKKVFLTGHTGFKGGWLIAWLHTLGAIVKGYSLESEFKTGIYNSINGDELCQSIIADVLDGQWLKREILEFQPDYIFHLAAQPLVKLSYAIPVQTFEVNIIGTANLLDAIRYLDKSCSVIVITTDKVYENREWPYPYRENDRLGGYDPYSASKACAELLVASYRNSFFNPANITGHAKAVASARAGNVIGGGDWSADRIIPDAVRALTSNTEIAIRNPLSVRPWQHVLEPLRGYLMLGASLRDEPSSFSDAFNFGPTSTDELKVEDLVKLAIKCWGSGSYKIAGPTGPHEAGILKLDINRTFHKLCWKPVMDAQAAISFTIKWYKEFELGHDMKDVTFEQISDYTDLVA